jgi:hypothetical protein
MAACDADSLQSVANAGSVVSGRISCQIEKMRFARILRGFSRHPGHVRARKHPAEPE